MVEPDNSVYLRHMLDSINKINEFVRGYDFEAFAGDNKTVSAVLREISVIGEAASRTTDKFRQEHPQIPWPDIFGMRNKLVHDYLGVRLDIVWKTVKQNLSGLKTQLNEVLGEK